MSTVSATPSAAVLEPLVAADFRAVRRLAHEIWHGHYDAIVGAAQVDFMLGRRTSDESLAAYLDAGDRWFDLLRVAGEPVGYVSHALAPDTLALKLEQLYLDAAHRGRGLGRLMLGHVEDRARALGRPTVVLQVNKRNAAAIAFYRRAGYAVREEAVFDIGGGFVMDDVVMARSIVSRRG